MNLQGKKVAFLGDSITEGVGASCAQNKYVEVFAQKTGAQIKNYGISGTRIAKQNSVSSFPEWDNSFIQRAEIMEDDQDIVVVFGGTSDFGHGDAPFGTMEDRTEDTFYGALHVLYQKLLKKYPKAVLLILTPLHRFDEKQSISKPQGGFPTLAQYTDAIRQVAEFYSLPVLDLWANSGMSTRVAEVDQYYFTDGLHPTDAGHARIASMLIAFLESYLSFSI